MTQAAGMVDALSGIRSTFYTFDTVPNSCVRVVRILVGQDPDTGNVTASLDQENTLGAAGVYCWKGGIAVNVSHSTTIVFHRSSSTAYLSSWWTSKILSAINFNPASALTTGTCTSVQQVTGDYPGAQTDPGGSNFWLAGERNTMISGICQWETQVIQITPP